LDTVSILRGQLDWAHNVMNNTIGDTPPEVLAKTLPGAQIGAIAGIYAHVVFGEDRQIQAQLQAKPTILESGGWDKKLNVEMPSGRQDLEWRSNFKMGLEGFMDYAKAVYESTDAYLAGLTPSDLEKTFARPDGSQVAIGTFLYNTATTHIITHMGEIAALKGVSGLKGLPF
jgi:hypothetical protein